MELKRVEISADLTTNKQTVVKSNTVFYNYDRQNALLAFKLLNNSEPLEKDNLKRVFVIVTVKSLGTQLIEELIYKNNFWEYLLSDELLSVDSEIKIELYIDLTNGSHLHVSDYLFSVQQDSSSNAFTTLRKISFIEIDNILLDLQKEVDVKKKEISEISFLDLKGDKGDKGEQGEQGIQGIKGIDGLNYETEEQERVLNELERIGNEENRVEKFGTYDGRITTLESDYAVLGTNLIQNGDFSNGTTGWFGVYGELSILNNELTYKLTSNTSASRIETSNINYIKDHKYYVSGEIYSTLSQVVKITFGDVFASNRYNLINQWDKVKGISIPTTTSSTPFRFYHGSVDLPLGSVWKYRNIIVIDLTDTFGSGSEPTESQMDRLLTQFPNSWFDGTKNIYLARWALNELFRQDRDKANIKQNEWITPTLLSGATGTFQYRKNNFGCIEFKGTLKGGDGGALVTLIQGYRPTESYNIVAPRVNGAGLKNVMIQPTGGVFFMSPYATETEVNFNGVSFTLD